MGNRKLDVVCFYWNGEDRPGWDDSKLGAKYVNILYKSIKNNLTIPFNFNCFTNISNLNINSKIIKRELDVPSWKYCLPKLKVFDPSNKFKGRVIMLDLDLLILGNLDEIFSYNGFFMTREGFRGHNVGKSGGDIVFFDSDGSMDWLWDIYNRKTEELETNFRGSERAIYRRYLHGRTDFLQRKFPNSVLSYRNHILKGYKIPKDCKIISFHGKPRPHEVNDKLVKNNWRN
jgi:hypothetical protein